MCNSIRNVKIISLVLFSSSVFTSKVCELNVWDVLNSRILKIWKSACNFSSEVSQVFQSVNVFLKNVRIQQICRFVSDLKNLFEISGVHMTADNQFSSFHSRKNSTFICYLSIWIKRSCGNRCFCEVRRGRGHGRVPPPHRLLTRPRSHALKVSFCDTHRPS